MKLKKNLENIEIKNKKQEKKEEEKASQIVFVILFYISLVLEIEPRITLPLSYIPSDPPPWLF